MKRVRSGRSEANSQKCMERTERFRKTENAEKSGMRQRITSEIKRKITSERKQGISPETRFEPKKETVQVTKPEIKKEPGQRRKAEIKKGRSREIEQKTQWRRKAEIKQEPNRKTESETKQAAAADKTGTTGKRKAETVLAVGLAGSLLLILWWSALLDSRDVQADTLLSGRAETVLENGKSTEADKEVEESKLSNSEETESESETDCMSEAETASEKEPANETEAMQDTETASETVPASTIAKAAGTDSGDETESEKESESGSKTAFGNSPEFEHAAEFESSSESERAMETEPGTETVGETCPESDPAVPSEYITEQMTEFLTERPPEASTEPPTEAVTEPLTEPPMEVSTESLTEPPTEAVTEPLTEPPTEAVTEPLTESLTEASTESLTEPPTEAATEFLTEPPTEAAAEHLPEASTEPPTEVSTESSTELSTEAVTEPLTESQEASYPKAPTAIERGRQYEIHGEEHAWYRDERDRLWIRGGTSVYVDVRGTEGYNRGGLKQKVKEDGSLTFQLRQVDKDGKILHRSELKTESYYVDSEAPAATIQSSGTEDNGVIYAAQTADFQVLIAPDGKSGLKRADYCVQKSGEAGALKGKSTAKWEECVENQSISIDEEGSWQVFVRTEDRVGNLCFSKSGVICVDRTPPEITVSGVKNQTANSGKLPIRVICQDSYYRPGSLKVRICGANSSQMPRLRRSEESGKGASAEYFDFPRERSYDDAYLMEVEAEDLAGNRTEQHLEFSVNRFGSVYDLSEQTREKLKSYYLTEPSEIVFLENNIDYVGESDIFCRKDGELLRLQRGADYQVTMQGSRESWKQYRYTIPAEYFAAEGIYELLLASRDQAKNESDTGLQEKRVTFVLDRTMPDCLITGVEGGMTYHREMVTAGIHPTDNVGIGVLRIFVDSVLLRELTPAQLREDTVKLELLQSDAWQTLQVQVCDLAGNEYWSPEIPVYIGAKVGEQPMYRRRKKSAQELAQQAQHAKEQGLTVRTILKEGMSEAVPETDEAYSGEADYAIRTAAGQELQAVQAAQSGQKQELGWKQIVQGVFEAPEEERSRRGILFAVFGMILFAVTILVCILPVRKRKK